MKPKRMMGDPESDMSDAEDCSAIAAFQESKDHHHGWQDRYVLSCFFTFLNHSSNRVFHNIFIKLFYNHTQNAPKKRYKSI